MIAEQGARQFGNRDLYCGLKSVALIYVKDVNELHILKKINRKRFGQFRNYVYLCTAIQNNA